MITSRRWSCNVQSASNLVCIIREEFIEQNFVGQEPVVSMTPLRSRLLGEVCSSIQLKALMGVELFKWVKDIYCSYLVGLRSNRFAEQFPRFTTSRFENVDLLWEAAQRHKVSFSLCLSAAFSPSVRG